MEAQLKCPNKLRWYELSPIERIGLARPKYHLSSTPSRLCKFAMITRGLDRPKGVWEDAHQVINFHGENV